MPGFRYYGIGWGEYKFYTNASARERFYCRMAIFIWSDMNMRLQPSRALAQATYPQQLDSRKDGKRGS